MARGDAKTLPRFPWLGTSAFVSRVSGGNRRAARQNFRCGLPSRGDERTSDAAADGDTSSA